VLHHHAVVAEAVLLCGTAALLYTGPAVERRQAAVHALGCGDEGKTKDACPRLDLRVLGLYSGSRAIGVSV
jgi:hypothetical protein